MTRTNFSFKQNNSFESSIVCTKTSYNEIYFSGQIEYSSISNLINTINSADETLYMFEDYVLKNYKEKLNLESIDYDTLPIFLHFSSVGGDADLAAFFINYVNSIKRPIIIIASSLVASAGVYIFLSFNKRYAFEKSYFMLHDFLIDFPGFTKLTDIKTFVSQNEQILKLMFENDLVKKTLIKEKIKDDHYLSVNDAKELGFFERIITSIKELEEYQNSLLYRNMFFEFYNTFLIGDLDKTQSMS